MRTIRSYIVIDSAPLIARLESGVGANRNAAAVTHAANSGSVHDEFLTAVMAAHLRQRN